MSVGNMIEIFFVVALYVGILNFLKHANINLARTLLLVGKVNIE